MIAVGDILDNTYRIKQVLAKGGMACLYLASHARLDGLQYAIKVIAVHGKGADASVRFRREGQILASLIHPNVVRVHDFNETPDGQLYLVMEYLSGEDLSETLRRSSVLPLSTCIQILRQLGEALTFAHERGVIHRDLKPANIFLCKDGPVPHFVKVLDFGIAKCHTPGSSQLTENVMLMGTPAYMSPEQACGQVGQLDARSDQFSLALVLYEMLSGRSAFARRGEAPMMTITRILTEEPAALSNLQLDSVIRRALRKAPEERYPSIAAFVDAVLGCCEATAEAPIPLPADSVRVSTASSGSIGSDPPQCADRVGSLLAPKQDAAEPPPASSSLGTKVRGELLPDRRASIAKAWRGVAGGLCALGVLGIIPIGLAWKSREGTPSQSSPTSLQDVIVDAQDAGTGCDLASVEPLIFDAGLDAEPSSVTDTEERSPHLPAPEMTTPTPDKPHPVRANRSEPHRIPKKVGFKMKGIPSDGYGPRITRTVAVCIQRVVGRSLRVGQTFVLKRISSLMIESGPLDAQHWQLNDCLRDLANVKEYLPKVLTVYVVEGSDK